MKFIDVIVGGPGVRLRKRQQKTSLAQNSESGIEGGLNPR